MKSNVGKGDRIFRAVLGVLIIVAGLYYGSWLGLIGIIPLLTAVVGWCPLYSLLGISTQDEKPGRMGV